MGLKPFGQYAFFLFSAGLFNASFFAACILPLSTVYTVCEGLGFESGVDKRFNEAPVFYWLYTFLIVVGAAVILIPGFDLVKMILLSQVINGVLLPFILIFMILLINKKKLMHEWTNSRFYNFVAWTSVALMIGLTMALVALSIQDMMRDLTLFQESLDAALEIVRPARLDVGLDPGFDGRFKGHSVSIVK